jgi:hypothetical protein
MEKYSTKVNALVYDSRVLVIGKDDCYVGSIGIAFDSFEISFYDLALDVAKMKIYVQPD